MKQKTKKVELTQKQNNAFKGFSKFLENRNFKKGLKVVEKLLEEVPNHPESIAMKATFLYHLGEEDKALEQGKRAVFLSKMQSQLCWEKYGEILRWKRDYPTALSAYKNALKYDPSNFSYLRELSNLQAQSKDYNGLSEIRYEILRQKANGINNWLGLAMAYYLKGDYSQALRTLASTTNLLQNTDLKPPQRSNFNIYYCMVYRESGNYEEFYKQLKSREKLILDKIVYRELLIEACVKLKKKQEAEQLVNELLAEFPENSDYFITLRKVKQLPEQTSQLQKLYSEIATKYKSRMASLLELSLIQDQKLFKKKFEEFVIVAYKKNLISIFSEINILYNRSIAHQWIGDALYSLQKSLRVGQYPSGEQSVSPTQFLWALYFRSQHLALNFQTLPDALKLVNEAIQHTPTLVELYMVKANILQKQHQHPMAIRTINQARQLDVADRYMNNICIKYMLRAGRTEMAQAVMRAFMGSEATAYDLQNMWYEIEMARCYLQKGEYAPGLRHLNFIQKQFQDMYEDQYDFHSYSLYRWTFKEYVDLVRYADDIYNDRRYMQAGALAIKYLMNFAIIKDQLPKPKEYKDQVPKLDYGGEQYMKKMKDSYQEALKWAHNIVSAKYVNKNNQHLNFIFFKAFGQALNLFIHLNKPMLALKALKKLIKTNSDQLVTHLYTLKAIKYFEKTVNTEIHPTTKEIIISSLSGLLKGAENSKDYNERVIKTWSKSPEATLRYEEAKLIIQNGKRDDYIHLYQRLLKQQNLPLKDAFRLVHKLEFYRVLDQDLKTKLNQRYGALTSYFTDWNKTIEEVRKQEWSEWWNEKWIREKEEDQGKGAQNVKKEVEEKKQSNDKK